MFRELFGRIKTASKMVTGVHHNALDLLRSDHMKVEALLIQLRLIRDSDRKKRLLAQVKSELTKHMRLEEEFFYPACSRIARLRGLIDHAHTDHQLVKNVLKDLSVMDVSSRQFNTLLTKLIIKLEKHINDEEEDIFSGVRRHMSKAEFSRMNRELIDEHSGEVKVHRKAA